MKQNTQVEETLYSSAYVQLEKHLSVKQILISSLVALCGVVGIVISLIPDKSDSTYSMAFLVIGTLLTLFSIYRFFFKSYEMVYKSTGSEVRSGSLYMDMAELQRLKEMLVKNDFPETFRLILKEGGNGRLDFLASKDRKFVAVQLFQFVPYTYEAVTGVRCYTDAEAALVARCVHL